MPKKSYKYAIPGAILVPKDGYYKIRKAGLTGERVKKDPVFHYTRLLAKEFSKVALWARFIRNALLSETGIKQRTCLLHGALQKILESDKDNFLGNRHLMHCDLSSLSDFNFNEHAPLEQVFVVPVTVVHKVLSNTLDIEVPNFIASEAIVAPPDITHARLYAIIATFDLATMEATVSKQQSTLIPIKAIKVKQPKLSMSIHADKNRLCMVALGISWYHERKKKPGLVRSKVRGSLAILGAWRTDELGNHFLTARKF